MFFDQCIIHIYITLNILRFFYLLRSTYNKLFRDKIGWEPNYPLAIGMETTFKWINSQVDFDNNE